MIKVKFSIAAKIKGYNVTLYCFLAFLSLKTIGQTSQLNTTSYINAYSGLAVNQMFEYKIPASVILAQAIFESGCGNSTLAKKSNNHFGIKCHTEWGGDTIRKSDDTLNECFRKYNNIQDSYEDHSLFLASRGRYKVLFQLSLTYYKGWCYGLKRSGYATYAFYPEVLIKIIEDFKLYEFDKPENLIAGTLLINNQANILESKYTPIGFSLKDLCFNDLLWNDEKHLLIQSLEMIVSNPNKEMDGIADN